MRGAALHRAGFARKGPTKGPAHGTLQGFAIGILCTRKHKLWTGRAQGTLETRRLEPRQIRAGALRFDPDELVLDKGKLVIVDVRI